MAGIEWHLIAHETVRTGRFFRPRRKVKKGGSVLSGVWVCFVGSAGSSIGARWALAKDCWRASSLRVRPVTYSDSRLVST